MKHNIRVLSLLAAVMLVLAACAGGPAATTAAPTTAPPVETTEAPEETTTVPGETTTTGAAANPVAVCLVTDLAGVDDRSFNASAWQGVLDSAAAGYVSGDPILLESDDQSDYQPNIDQCLSQGAQHIVTVGFELGEATASNAAANADVNFTIVDFGYDPDIPNVRELVYQTDEAAFAGGYLAAGVSQSGIIGTYGGLNIPTVSIFLDGLTRGVAHYNEIKGTDVRVVGWDVDAQDGSFTGTFDPADPAVRALCESILDEGADIMLPVGGAINLPCGTAILDRGLDAALIGVDADAFNAMPAEYQDLWLVTIEKGIAIQVQRSIAEHAGGMWTPGGVVGNLENDAVGLSEYHSWADRVPAELDAEVQQILADIKAGALDASFFQVG
ncbi:MAG: BMP family lipoprotein [Actinomycetota bacterium]